MEKVIDFFGRYWRLMLVGLIVGLLAYIMLFRGIGTLTNSQFASAEFSAQQQAISLRTIFHSPVNAPYELLVWAALKLGHHSLLVTRIAAASFAVAIAVLFYWVAVHWYSKRIAFMSSILFVSSSGFLNVGRYGTALVLQMLTLVLISCVFIYRRARHELPVAYGLVAVLAVALYIPGFVWFELIGLWLLRKRILAMFRGFGPLHTSLISLLGVVLVSPLVWQCLQQSSVLREISGFPATFPTLPHLAKEALHLGSSIMYRGYWPSDYWLYGAPLLNIGEVVLFITGLLLLLKRPILRGNYFLLGTLVVSSALIVLGGSITIAMLIPLIYLTIAGGIYHFLDEWLTIFPRNPVARSLGIALICCFALFSALYHVRAYYKAWPNAPETKAVYTIRQPS